MSKEVCECQLSPMDDLIKIECDCKVKDPMLMNDEEFAEFLKGAHPEYAEAWTIMRYESLVNQLLRKFMNPEKQYRKQLL